MSLCSDFVYFSGCYVSRLLVVSQYFFFFLCSCFTFMSLRFGTSLQAFVVRVHHVVCCESLCPHYYLTFFCFAVIFHLLFSISLWHFFGFYFTCAFFCSCCCFVYLYCDVFVSFWSCFVSLQYCCSQPWLSCVASCWKPSDERYYFAHSASGCRCCYSVKMV